MGHFLDDLTHRDGFPPSPPETDRLVGETGWGQLKENF